MRTSINNCTVVEKLEDEDEVVEVNESADNEVKIEFYNEWKAIADETNSRNYNNNLVVSSGPETEIYQSDNGTIVAFWNKKTKNGYVKANVGEGSMGGINRSHPAQDVSYEKVLDEVMQKWLEESQQELNELSVSALDKYRHAAASPDAIKTRPLRKLAKSVSGVKNATDKIDAATGNRSGKNAKYGQINHNHHSATYEERLAEFLDIDEDFTSLLKQQTAAHQQQQQAKRKVVPIDYHGWTIKYRAAGEPGDKVDWVIYNKKGELVKKGEASSDREAVNQAQEFINQGGGTKKEANSNVTIDFNVDFAKQFAPDNDSVYVAFDNDNGVPQLLLSLVPQNGFKKTHIRNQKHKMTATTTALPVVSLSPKESNALGLQPNGRYVLGSKDPIDDNTAMFPLIFQGVVQGKGDLMRMGKPGLTVAHTRELDELYQGPWQGDPEKYAKAPKSTTMGGNGVTLGDLVKDSIKVHGLKWAFNYYVKKHGMPPRHFKIYAGL